MPGQFDLQQNFPVASIADLVAQRPYKEQLMRAQQQQQLVSGLKDFSSGVDSLVQRRQQMAQALASAKIFSQTPEGQQIMGTNPVATSPTGAPVTQNQTATYDPMTGTVTPNQSPVNTQTLQTAFMGAKPEDILKNITEQSNQRRLLDQNQQNLALEGRKQKLAETIEPQKVALETQIQNMLAGIKGQEAATAQVHTANEDVNALRTRRDALIKNLSPLPNWLNPAGAEAEKEIANIDAVLAAKGQGPVAGQPGGSFNMPSAPGESVTHPSGVTIKRLK